jgi:hypothetical protein
MKLYKKLTKIGTGYWLLIPQKIVRDNELIENDMVEIEINKIQRDKLIEYRCERCLHQFCLNANESLFCPSCGEEDMNAFTKLVNSEEIPAIDKLLVDLTVTEFLFLLNSMKGGVNNGN